jgi:hypothetical protein
VPRRDGCVVAFAFFLGKNLRFAIGAFFEKRAALTRRNRG